ncbi:hypothetical protein BT93_H3252 [Corymbia citriodora subsp. variegata]|nr:hypothetical protein BT93_H3252 [Corymbia citriodora subsp. variegata]
MASHVSAICFCQDNLSRVAIGFCSFKEEGDCLDLVKLYLPTRWFAGHCICTAVCSVRRGHQYTFNGYSFKYPQNWVQVRGAGADIFSRDHSVMRLKVSRWNYAHS